jgi:hypothetical protein
MMWHEASFRIPQQIALADRYLLFHTQAAGLFFLPLVAAALFAVHRRRDLAFIAVPALLLLPSLAGLLKRGHPMPYFASPWCCDIFPGNVLNDFTLGQPTLPDVWSRGLPYPWHLAHAARLALTFGALGAAAVAIFVVIRALLDGRVAPRLAALAAMAMFAGLLGSGIYVDRYSLDAGWMLAVAAAFVVTWERRAARATVAALLVVVALFDVLALQEYFAWQRARWAAYRELRAAGVAVTAIDGGVEASNLYEMRFMNQHQRLLWLREPPRPYLLAFRPLPGYGIVARHPFDGWLGWHRGAVYTLRRLSGTSG